MTEETLARKLRQVYRVQRILRERIHSPKTESFVKYKLMKRMSAVIGMKTQVIAGLSA